MKMTHISASPLLSGECLLNITLEKGQNQAAQQLLDEIGTDVRLWDLDIKKTPKKRSLDSNSYYWVLCGKLAAKLKSTPLDIYRQHILDIGDNYVAPRAGAWIEISLAMPLKKKPLVAPRAGAWIEIHHSPPKALCNAVAPRAGAWIEMFSRGTMSTILSVAPRAGAWIEIACYSTSRACA